MFDTTKPFSVKILSGGTKQCSLRWPTDEEWAERSRRTKVTRRVLSGGRTRREKVSNVEADSDLFAAVRIDKDGQEFDAFDACAAVQKLDRVLFQEAARKGDLVRIKLEVADSAGKLIEVSACLRIPTQRQKFKYDELSTNVIDHRRTQELQSLLEPAGTLFDAICESTQGYTSPVPITHKDVYVFELFQALAPAEDDPDPEL